MSLPMEKARYRGTAIGVSFGTAKSTGNPQIAITFEVLDEGFGGETIAWFGHFTDKTAERTLESLRHAGWKGDELADLADLDEAAVRAALPDPVDLACEVEAGEDENGQVRDKLKVRWVNKAGGGRFEFKTKLEGGDLRAFSAQMKATARSARTSSSSTRTSGGSRGSDPHPNAPGSRDDIPF